MRERIKKGVYTLSHTPFNHCSMEAKDLITKLILTDPAKRYTSRKAYEHPWVQQQILEENKDLNIHEEVFTNLKSLLGKEISTAKKSLLMFMATQIPE